MQSLLVPLWDLDLVESFLRVAPMVIVTPAIGKATMNPPTKKTILLTNVPKKSKNPINHQIQYPELDIKKFLFISFNEFYSIAEDEIGFH